MGIYSTSSLCAASCSCLVHHLSGAHPPRHPAGLLDPSDSCTTAMSSGRVQPTGMDSHLVLLASLPSASLALGIKGGVHPASAHFLFHLPLPKSLLFHVRSPFPVSSVGVSEETNSKSRCVLSCCLLICQCFLILDLIFQSLLMISGSYLSKPHHFAACLLSVQ